MPGAVQALGHSVYQEPQACPPKADSRGFGRRAVRRKPSGQVAWSLPFPALTTSQKRLYSCACSTEEMPRGARVCGQCCCARGCTPAFLWGVCPGVSEAVTGSTP
ncbi:hypothetical protein EI555_006748 [Monodon monoceros]|uniref:Uncharacterized protein n=1 Tax=Monodon monoceros TaxID=40151 RepID=A0A4V5P9B6_MONMO|nr:hypothetical protein EI555_006748 [Monodon monoceros]